MILNSQEFDYVGVIFGDDLIYSFDQQSWLGDKSNSADGSVKKSKESFVDLVKNTYRVLLSRGMKGCYVYFTNKETERFFKSRIEKVVSTIMGSTDFDIQGENLQKLRIIV